MKKTTPLLTLLLCLGALTFAQAENSSEQLIEQAFKKRLYVEFERDKLSGKECEALGKVDERNENTTVEYDGYVYSLELKNRSDLDFENLHIECRLYYEEEKIWRTKRSDKQKVVKYYDYSFDIPKLSSRTEINTNTAPFILFSRKLPSGWFYYNDSSDILESTEEGFWMRVSRTSLDGTTIHRDFCEPKSLPSRVDW